MKNKNNQFFKKFRESTLVNLLYDKGVLYFCLSFYIPVIIMLYSFRKNSIHPFGEQQMLVVDLWHQYYPFFRVLREKLLNGGSMLYSWQNGMGTNFLSLISYYASSPLNWISIFFDDEHTRDALTYILIAKIGFSGAFFSCFLRYTYKRKDLSIVIFSCMFALCSYMLGYYWNVMWFDTIALFPLVMTGIVMICRERKWVLYTVSLGLSLVSNYYIGYFTCIFTMFMFASAVIIEGKGIKDFFVKLWLIVRSSVIGIGMGAFILLPAYYGLQLTYSVNNTFPKELSWYEKWTDIFANLLSYSKPAMKEGLPNFACGMLAVTLFGVFLFSGGIKIREKISSLLMLALIAVSCNMNKLNYIWHGFHVTNQIPYRFAFIFSFVLVVSSFRAYDAIINKKIKIYQLFLLIPAPAVVFFLNYRKSGDEFEFEGAFRSSAIITLAYILVFAAVKIFPFKNFKVKRSIMNIALAVVVIFELLKNAVIGVETVGTSSYTSYPASQTGVQQVLSDMRARESSPFYRTEMTRTYTLNDSALYGYYGLSQFSSSANVSVTKFFRRMGLYASEAGNRYYYRISTPLVNSLLGIKYIVSKSGLLNSEEYSLEYIESADNVHLYENKYPLSLGFMMNNDILFLKDNETVNPFVYQNDVIDLATGSDYDLFTPQPVALATYNNMKVIKNSYGNYTFTKEDNAKPASSTYEFDGLEGKLLYGYASNGGCDSVSVKCDDVSVDSGISIKDYPIVFPMGNGQKESRFSVEMQASENKNSGSFKLMVYAFNQAHFESAYNEFADEQLNITSFSDTEIIGDIDVKEDGILYLSVPYEKGWTVYADGEKIQTVKVLHSMLGAKLGKGHHDIRIVYSPEGFSTGLVISVSALLLFVLFAVADGINRKKKSQKSEVSSEMEADYEKSQSNDGLSGNELPRLSETEQCNDDTGNAGNQTFKSSE